MTRILAGARGDSEGGPVPRKALEAPACYEPLAMLKHSSVWSKMVDVVALFLSQALCPGRAGRCAAECRTDCISGGRGYEGADDALQD